jgi:hypothetical protein
MREMRTKAQSLRTFTSGFVRWTFINQRDFGASGTGEEGAR